jgi:membrane-bound lytic murein transglycosylase A
MLRLLPIVVVLACSSPDKSPVRPADAERQGQTPAAAPAECPPVHQPIVLSCDDDEPGDATASTGDDKLSLVKTSFDRLPGWQADELADAVKAFLRSCAALAAMKDRERVGVSPYGGRARDWRRACKAAAEVPDGDHGAARAFFEAEFTPYEAHGKSGPKAKLSGYFVQEMRGSRTRKGKYRYPVLARPDDLVSIQLSEFIDDGRGRRIWGRYDEETGTIVPYPTRREIREQKLGKPLIWVDDPVDALFAGIEGSGKAIMDDGSVLWIGFAGKNGRTYRGVGGTLRRLGELQRGQGTMNGIRAWFDAHPDRFQQITEVSESKVFFEIQEREGAIGTQEVILTPRRSLAVDRAVIALSTPVYVSTRAPTSARGRARPWHQLLIAQDTGGAILGPIRGDVYWGHDREAAAIGGRMGGSGKMWLLLPRGLKVKSKG